VTVDLDGNPRIVDDPGRHDTGIGTQPLIDIGCYEFQGDSTGITYLFVEPDVLKVGQNAVFTTLNANPNGWIYLVYSVYGPGSTYVPILNVTIDLEQPKRTGVTRATDAGGNIQGLLMVPPSAGDRDIWFQGAQRHNKTNVVATSVVY
jgi:hypothetical protein